MIPTLINKCALISSLVFVSGGALFAGSALAVTADTGATASVNAVLSISSTATADFGAITPPATDVTAADIVVRVISNGTPGTNGIPTSGYTLTARRNTATDNQAISLMSGNVTTTPLSTNTAFAAGASAFALLTNSDVQFASRTSGSGVSPEAGDPFPVSLRLPTFAWQAAAASATIGVVTFTAVAT